MKKMEVKFLGTNGWYDTPTGNTSCVLFDTAEHYIVLDAGSGFQKLRGAVHDTRPVFLFISHLHLDHLIGLHTLPLFNFPQGIDIFTPKPFEKLLRGFLKRPFTSPPAHLKTRLRFHAIDRDMRFSFGFKTARLRHSVPCYGYRFDTPGGSVTYCTDTGDCASLSRLAARTDLLITECALAPGDRSPNLFHITPETAARAADKARAKSLALFHFDPGRYPSFAERDEAQASARKIFPDTIAARDGTVIDMRMKGQG